MIWAFSGAVSFNVGDLREAERKKNMNIPIMYRTYKYSGAASAEEAGWVGRVLLNGTASSEQVAAAVAEQTGQSVSDVMYTNTKTGEAVRALLRSGYNVSLDWIAFQIVMTGKFDSVDSQFSHDRNSLLVRTHARSFLRDCLRDVTPRNVTNGLRASIQSVIDSAAKVESVITTPTVYVAGLNILVGDASDEGVWLVAKDGAVAAVPSITANTESTMDLAFDELPQDGDYTLVVKARSGASTDFAPAVARRKVTVRSAS